MKKCYVMSEFFEAGFRTEEKVIFVCTSKKCADKLKSQHLNWFYEEVDLYD